MTETTRPRDQLANLLRDEVSGDVYTKHNMNPDWWEYVGIEPDGNGGYGAVFVSRNALAQKGPRYRTKGPF